MAFNPNEWSINYATKKISNNDSPFGTALPVNKGSDASTGTVLQFFQWCASVFAQSSQMDDEYAFVSDTPNVYRFVNGWSFGYDASDYKYLKGGSIETSDGSILYSNLYSIGSQETGTQIYMIQADAEVSPWWISGNIDILVEVKRDGQFIYTTNNLDVSTAGGVWMYAREFGDNFDHNFATLSGAGSTPIGINTAPDSGNTSGEVVLAVTGATGSNLTLGKFLVGGTSGAVGRIGAISGDNIYMNAIRTSAGASAFTGTETLTEYNDRELQSATGQSTAIVTITNAVKGYSDISNTFGTISRDLNNGTGAQSYDVEINCATRPMTQVYQWLKYIVRYGSVGGTYTVNSDDGQEYRSAAETTGGGATGGGPYTDVKVAPFGTLAGSTMYGARGVWFTNYAAATFVLTDSTGTAQSPPNYQKVTATNALLNACQVFVAEITGVGGSIIKNKYTIDSSTANTLVVTTTIDINRTPQSGVFRIADAQYVYTGFSASTFTGVTPTPGVGTVMYVPLLDVLADATTEQSDNIIYSAPFDVRTVVRKYGFKPYTADTTFGSTGLSFSPILTIDPQAT